MIHIRFTVNRQIGRAREKLIALFVDLRAAFDTVDKGILVEIMRRKGVREGLVRKAEKVVRETKSRVKADGRRGRVFGASKGVETRVLVESFAVQHSRGKRRGGDRKGKVGKGEDRKRESIHDAICG